MSELTSRVRAVLRDLKSHRRFTQARVAERLQADPSLVSHVLNDEARPITLEFLEAVSEETGIPPAELVAPIGSLAKQLDADQAALLRHMRGWPKSVQHALLGFVGYWADETPADAQTRRLQEFWRRMKTVDREWFFGIAALIHEGMLAPDLRAGLTDRLEAERNKRLADAEAQRRRDARRRRNGP